MAKAHNGVTLTLSESEARALAFLLGHVGGEGAHRRELGGIADALTGANIHWAAAVPYIALSVRTVGNDPIIWITDGELSK